ncbi:ABC transporter ATP-binding protein [Streptomyces sp. WI04-05B]|uniref:ABC transporter ATP-binding protein n=1 Tax=Streptomyces TaxID=1883 RepID=UPI0029B07B46|nr:MULTISPECIES: ATP-binding cassette domain-containing protein [unclassified Streptomyces]MDX2543493.1 ATP-binding cassette domain-containing protein [Streptomyces sp. WI04-05B]MDX2589162.1 ATP-binding cassette domain-containing protein [Streptomyces sp. WI04-05A]
MSGSIEVSGLSRTFHTTVRRPGFAGALRSLVNPERVAKHAVSDISFEVAPGELLALLGPNGAGKSTTIKMLTGILTPTSGEARVAGVVPYLERERNARNIGAVFGQRTQLWWDLPVRESFSILRDIYEIPKAEHAVRLREFDDLLELSTFWDTRVRHLSLGQRVRCDLAAALLHDPRVVFLDEPTIGMDVVVKEQVREFLRHQVEERGRTVLLTTHDMTEVERLAERVVLVNHGRLVLDGTLDEIKKRFGSTWQVRATLADPHTEVEALPGIALLRHEGPQVVFGPDGPAAPTVHQALKRVIERYEVTDIALDEADLEDVMRAAYVQAEVPESYGGV